MIEEVVRIDHASACAGRRHAAAAGYEALRTVPVLRAFGGTAPDVAYRTARAADEPLIVFPIAGG